MAREVQMLTRLPERLRKQFRAACRSERRSMSAQIEVLIMEWLDRRSRGQ